MNDQRADLMTKTVVFSVAQIESICDEFECQWSPDLPSDFEHYLSQVSDVASPTLLRNLLQIELRGQLWCCEGVFVHVNQHLPDDVISAYAFRLTFKVKDHAMTQDWQCHRL